jgi:hypothetical protein
MISVAIQETRLRLRGARMAARTDETMPVIETIGRHSLVTSVANRSTCRCRKEG